MPVTQAEIEAAARSRYRREWGGVNGMPINYEATMQGYRAAAKEDLEAAERARWQPIETAKKDVPILVRSREGHYGVGSLFEWDAGYWTDGVIPLTESEFIEQFDMWRHLLPLPSPPEST